jgi:hypothetical protein
VTGRGTDTDEDKALASWLWRCTHFAHGESGPERLWDDRLDRGPDAVTREYWAGLFSQGFALCGATHAQWTAEFDRRLGHACGRVLGCAGHNSFEAFLSGGEYGAGRWAAVDHDLCTVAFDPGPTAAEVGPVAGPAAAVTRPRRLLGLNEIAADWRRLTDRRFRPARQRGWPVCGLHPGDAPSFAEYRTAEYLAGYAGPPPQVHLRRGETFRRYLDPGLADGRTFAFWGRNAHAGGVPGPERAETFVNDPDRMFGSTATGVLAKAGRARFGNAVFTYRPDFATDDYREAVADEGPGHVTFTFASPYVIAATPANDREWGVLDPGGRNGLVLRGTADCAVSLSTDGGRTWADCGRFADGLDPTDRVKGRRAYRLRLHAGAAALRGSGLTLTTVCQANPAVMPRLTDDGCRLTFRAGGTALASAGPDRPTAAGHLVAGRFDSPAAELEVRTPQGSRSLPSTRPPTCSPATRRGRPCGTTSSCPRTAGGRGRRRSGTGPSRDGGTSRPTSGRRAFATGRRRCRAARRRCGCGSATTAASRSAGPRRTPSTGCRRPTAPG